MCPGLEVERPWRLGFPSPHWTASDTFATSNLKALTGSVVSLAQSRGTGEHLAGPPIPLRLQCPRRLLRLEGPKPDVPRNFQGRISSKRTLFANKKTSTALFFSSQGYPQLSPNRLKTRGKVLVVAVEALFR
jgi:hypothetical protein